MDLPSSHLVIFINSQAFSTFISNVATCDRSFKRISDGEKGSWGNQEGRLTTNFPGTDTMPLVI